MKRHAILLGNTNGLNGVQKDLVNFKKFLMDDKGGCWYENEILMTENISLAELENHIEEIKKSKFDYVIFYFSGHGGMERTTKIELNERHEIISESAIMNLALRQLSIFDCCRCYPEQLDEFMSSECFSSFNKSFFESFRQRYEKRIMQAAPQQMVLYSCKEGEFSQDTEVGGIYTTNFLKCANEIESDFKTVLEAHSKASSEVSRQTDYKQNPSYKMVKIPSDKQLIIAISNKYVRSDYPLFS